MAAALSVFAQVVFFNPVLGVLLPEFEREFGWSRTQVSLGATTGTLLGAAIAPLFGPLVDRYGGRRFVIGAGLIMAVGLIGMANMQTYWQYLLFYSAGRAMSSGLLNMAATVTVAKWFVRRRGIAVGATTVGTRAAFAILPLVAQFTIEASDWRTAAYLLAAVVALVGTIPAFLWLHRRPEDFGQLPDDDRIGSKSQEKGSGRERSWSRHDAIRTRGFWLLTAAVSLQGFAIGAVNLHQVAYMVDKGLAQADAALILSLFAVFAGLGAVVEGALDHWLGARRTFIFGLLMAAVGIVLLLMVNSFLTGFVFAMVYGMSLGLMLTSHQVVFADFYGRESLGAIFGAASPFFMFVGAFGPMVGGLFHDVTGNYTSVFILFGIGYVVAAILVSISRAPKQPNEMGAQVHPASVS